MFRFHLIRYESSFHDVADRRVVVYAVAKLSVYTIDEIRY